MLDSIPLLPIWILSIPLVLGIIELARTPKSTRRGPAIP